MKLISLNYTETTTSANGNDRLESSKLSNNNSTCSKAVYVKHSPQVASNLNEVKTKQNTCEAIWESRCIVRQQLVTSRIMLWSNRKEIRFATIMMEATQIYKCNPTGLMSSEKSDCGIYDRLWLIAKKIQIFLGLDPKVSWKLVDLQRKWGEKGSWWKPWTSPIIHYKILSKLRDVHMQD